MSELRGAVKLYLDSEKVVVSKKWTYKYNEPIFNLTRCHADNYYIIQEGW